MSGRNPTRHQVKQELDPPGSITPKIGDSSGAAAFFHIIASGLLNSFFDWNKKLYLPLQNTSGTARHAGCIQLSAEVRLLHKMVTEEAHTAN